MASVVAAEVTTFLKIINLSVSCLKSVLLLRVYLVVKVLVGLLRPCYQYVSFSVRVVRHLEVADGVWRLKRTRKTDLGGGKQVVAVPIPKKDLPVRLPSQGYNDSFISWVESAVKENTTLVLLAVFKRLR